MRYGLPTRKLRMADTGFWVAVTFSRGWKVLIKKVRSFGRLLVAEDRAVLLILENGVVIVGFLGINIA
jgi:hypothetical protein